MQYQYYELPSFETMTKELASYIEILKGRPDGLESYKEHVFFLEETIQALKHANTTTTTTTTPDIVMDGQKKRNVLYALSFAAWQDIESKLRIMQGSKTRDALKKATGLREVVEISGQVLFPEKETNNLGNLGFVVQDGIDFLLAKDHLCSGTQSKLILTESSVFKEHLKLMLDLLHILFKNRIMSEKVQFSMKASKDLKDPAVSPIPFNLNWTVAFKNGGADFSEQLLAAKKKYLGLKDVLEFEEITTYSRYESWSVIDIVRTMFYPDDPKVPALYPELSDATKTMIQVGLVTGFLFTMEKEFKSSFKEYLRKGKKGSESYKMLATMVNYEESTPEYKLITLRYAKEFTRHLTQEALIPLGLKWKEKSVFGPIQNFEPGAFLLKMTAATEHFQSELHKNLQSSFDKTYGKRSTLWPLGIFAHNSTKDSGKSNKDEGFEVVPG